MKIKPGPTSASDTVSNPYSWNAHANLLFVDQPVGTGFSYSKWPLDYVTSEKQVAQQLYDFLQVFFVQYPELQGRPFYVTGESYAGHYVPAIGYKIVDANAQGTEGPHINLQGIAIGNGLVEPLTQYGAYSDYMFSNGLVSDDVHDSVNEAYNATCAPAIVACQTQSRAAVRSAAAGLPAVQGSPMACIVAADVCNAAVVEPLLNAAAAQEGHSINVYDIRDACSHPPLCYDFSDLEAYMALPDVAEALGVSGKSWSECSTTVHLLLTDDWMTNLEVHIPNVLAAGVRVLVYAGDQDFICNVEGNRRWVDLMEWDGAETFAAAKPTAWTVAGAPAGTARTAQGLTFLQVFNAGHMVPMDAPKASLDMLRRFIKGSAFTADEADVDSVPMAALSEATTKGAVSTLKALWARLVGGSLVDGAASAAGAARRAMVQ